MCDEYLLLLYVMVGHVEEKAERKGARRCLLPDTNILTYIIMDSMFFSSRLPLLWNYFEFENDDRDLFAAVSYCTCTDSGFCDIFVWFLNRTCLLELVFRALSASCVLFFVARKFCFKLRFLPWCLEILIFCFTLQKCA